MKPLPAFLTSADSTQNVAIPRPLIDIWKQCVLDYIKLPRSMKVPPSPLKDERFFLAMIGSQRETILRLWEAFTVERSAVGRYLMDPKREAIGYLLAFHLTNQARLLGCLQRVHQRSPFVKRLLQYEGPLRFLDIGAGTGALGQLFAYLNATAGKADMQLDLIEGRGAFAEIAAAGLRHLDPAPRHFIHKVRLEKGYPVLARCIAEAENGLIGLGLGYIWNEIATTPAAATTLTRTLRELAASGKQGFLILMEPSNQNIARAAMAFRDELVGYGYRIVYPCPCTDELCPMNAESRDWCYSEFGFDRPTLLQKVDMMLDIQRTRIGSACFVMATPALAEAWKIGPQDAPVIVGRPLARKHPRFPTYAYLLCKGTELARTKPVPHMLTGLRGEIYSEQQAQASSKAGAKSSPSPKASRDDDHPAMRRGKKSRRGS